MEQNLLVIYGSVLLLCFVYAICKCSNFFFFDKRSEKEINKFIETKGKVYIVLGITSIFYTFILDDKYEVIIINTVCIALFEAIQCIFQARSSDFKIDVQEKMNNIKHIKRSEQQSIKLLNDFCISKLYELGSNPTEAEKQLIYEELNDYLRYYEDANKLLEEIKNYNLKENDIERILKIQEDFISDFKYTCIRVVKVPE